MEYTIQTDQLSYNFSKGEQVLNNINLLVPKGSIYGFLGPNGAGKTTTLKLVLGLLKKQQGTISVLGQDLQEHRIEILKNVGSLIESPSLYGHLTATENLKIWQKVYQCPKERIEEVLRIVDLDKTGKKKAGKFSLGMKQRLSIAIALLHSPELLILDEPTNGLDPNGIKEVRELLTKINKEGVTIVISSHLLSEIEKMINHVGIIHEGSIVFQGTFKDLQIRQTSNSLVAFEVSDNEKSIAILKESSTEFTEENGRLIVKSDSIEETAKLNEKLVAAGIGVHQIATVKNDLESIFMDITNTKQS
jgi:ABC-type multidrug transport system ATPase subunit